MWQQSQHKKANGNETGLQSTHPFGMQSADRQMDIMLHTGARELTHQLPDITDIKPPLHCCKHLHTAFKP